MLDVSAPNSTIMRAQPTPDQNIPVKGNNPSCVVDSRHAEASAFNLETDAK